MAVIRLCFIVDARSPIACNWIRHFVQVGDDVHVISTFPFSLSTLEGVKGYVAPIVAEALGGIRTAEETPLRPTRMGWHQTLVAATRNQLRGGRLGDAGKVAFNYVALAGVAHQAEHVRELVSAIQPDLVHAMRIPFEGILAARTVRDERLVMSVWGNDFTLQARTYPVAIGVPTRQALPRADALLCDCHRDVQLAQQWGFDAAKPSAVVPGSGGVRTDIFSPGTAKSTVMSSLKIEAEVPVVLNPRGFRSYVNNDVFLRAARLVLGQCPTTVFVMSAMQGEPTIERMIRDLGIGSSMRLLPKIAHNDMADIFRAAQVVVSPSTHDGTPNSLLEAMACGCFPVAGRVDSVCEWIEDNVNGLLCDPNDHTALAGAMLRALGDNSLRRTAREHNLALIQRRANYSQVMGQIEGFYRFVIDTLPAPRHVARGR